MSAASLFEGNAESQGYRLTAREQRELRFAVRFPTGLCLPLVITALVLGSPVMLLAMAAIGAVAGFTPRHPFDYLWNHGVRRFVRQPALPPNPRRRRHAFKLGTALLLTLAALFGAGLDVPGLVLGGMLVAACSSATFLNFCVPSEILARLERLRGRDVVAA